LPIRIAIMAAGAWTWSAVLITTASMSFCSSSMRRKSTWRRALGCCCAALSRFLASMSQSATMFSLATPFRFAAPRPVTPMQARFSFSFGEAETRGSQAAALAAAAP
jgi:hypothetical protein